MAVHYKWIYNFHNKAKEDTKRSEIFGELIMEFEENDDVFNLFMNDKTLAITENA